MRIFLIFRLKDSCGRCASNPLPSTHTNPDIFIDFNSVAPVYIKGVNSL